MKQTKPKEGIAPQKEDDIPDNSDLSLQFPPTTMLAFAGPVIEQPYDVKIAASLLDALRRSLPKHEKFLIPENLFELPYHLHSKLSPFLRYCPYRLMTLKKYYEEAANGLLDSLDLHDVEFNTEEINSIEEVFSFLWKLNRIVDDTYFEAIKDLLKDAFRNSCRTDKEKEGLLRAALNGIGFPAATVQLEPPPTATQSQPSLPEGAPPLPEVAPELYAGRQDRKENPVEFVKRVYGAFLARGLDRPTLLKLDKQLYHGLNQWRLRHGWPDGFDLPKKFDLVNRELEATPQEAIRAGHRLSSASYRRR